MKDKQDLNRILKAGAIAAFLVVAGSVLDIIVGAMTGGNIDALPRTAIDRFSQLRDQPWLGLYYLDLLNMITMVVMVPAFFALYLALRKSSRGTAGLALALFLIGTAVFVANNTALPMFDLSRKFYASTSSYSKGLIAAAGEAMLARGAHGSPGVFMGFTLVLLSEVAMSLAMIRGKVFGKTTAWTGFAGSSLMLAYVVLVTFVPGMKAIAMYIALPGGLLLMVWMLLFGLRLLKI